MNNFFWTEHAKYKMKQYGLSEQRVKRVIRAPYRLEEGIVKNTVAVMVPAGNFKLPRKGEKPSFASSDAKALGDKKASEDRPAWKQELWVMYQIGAKKTKIISAWRYPGVSPKNNPIPEEILREISRLARGGLF